METYTVRKTTKFCYAHSLPNHPHCDPLHGHNAIVTMEVMVEKLTGPWNFVIDFGDLKEVSSYYDHSGELITASAEDLAADIGRTIHSRLDPEQKPQEIKVTIEETPGSVVEWRWASAEVS